MLMPSKVKHRKQQKGKRRGLASRGNKVNFGEYGLQVLGRGWITSRQIEAARIAITRHVKRGGNDLFSCPRRQPFASLDHLLCEGN